MGKRIEFDLEEVTKLAAAGLTQEQIADSLGVCERTVRNRLADDAGFAAAIKKGQAQGLATIANALFDSAAKGNTAAQIFFLKCRGGWQEPRDRESAAVDDIADALGRLNRLRQRQGGE